MEVERSRDFLLQAKRDLEQARLSLREGFFEWAAFAAQQARAAGVDGTALQIGEADELHDALGGEVSKLVCRAILRAARSKAGARDLLKSVSSGEDSPTSPFLKGDAGALCGLTSVGRRRALELRCVD